uniref:Reverse transcriptase zinc-binding domain-containing protein n=1 Tax=Anolis carolinensis TaxID=28377 RepID=A0A803SQ31_ANOCA
MVRGKKTREELWKPLSKSTLLRTWEKYKTRFYSKTPLWVSPIESFQRREMGWNMWPVYKDILRKENKDFRLKSHDEINTNLTKISWLQYYQLQEYFNKDKKVGFATEISYWDVIIKEKKKVVTKIYKTLLEWSTETEVVKQYMINWARNIGRSITLEEWETIWKRKMNYTYSYELKENIIKMTHQWYLTPHNVAKMSKDLNGNCWKCGQFEGTFHHLWWNCNKAKLYWKEIHEISQKILKIKIPLKPEFFLLGLTNTDWSTNTDKLFTYIITAARIVYARVWRQKVTPTKDQWLEKMLDIMNMDELTSRIATMQLKTRKKTDWIVFKEWMKENKAKLII